MVSLTERIGHIVVLALNDIDNVVEKERFDGVFEQYIETLKSPLSLYRDHSAQIFPSLETLRGRFKYETALLHVVSRALAFDIGLENTDLIRYLPAYQPNDLYGWYSLPEELRDETDKIAADLIKPDFFREFIPNLSQHIQSRASDHDLGEYYTPFSIVEHLIDVSGLTPGEIVGGKRVIDPACGSGIILITIAQSIVDYSLKGHCDAFAAMSALCGNLFGFDVQPFAIALTKSLLVHISSLLFNGIDKLPVPAFPNIRIVDTLLTDDEYWNEGGFFHYVIGNPPFVSVKKEHIVHSQRYKDILYGHPNLYQLFLWWAVKATVPNGKVAFVLPQSVLIGIYSKELRAKLSELTIPTSMTRMIDRYGIVADADQQMMVVCLQVRPHKVHSKYVEVRVTRNGNDIHTTAPKLISRHRIIQNVASSTIWVVSDKTYDYTIVERLEAQSSMLSDMSDQIRIGNGSFVWNQHKDLLSAHRVECSIPLISSASINPYLATFPYTGTHSTRERLYVRMSPEVQKKRHSKEVLLVQRTTPRKTGRRIVAGLLPGEFYVQNPTYFIENHVNYVHVLDTNDRNTLFALNVWLNSDIVNFAFQLRNGTAHISLFELKALPVIPRLMDKISQQSTKLLEMPEELRFDIIYRLNSFIFDWIGLSTRHRKRISTVMSLREHTR